LPIANCRLQDAGRDESARSVASAIRNSRRWILLAMLSVSMLAGCAYRVGSTLDDRPPRTCEFGTVENQLFPPRPGLEYQLTRRLKEEMAGDLRLRLVSEGGNVRLRVTLLQFEEPTIVKDLDTAASSEILLRATVVVEATGEVPGGKIRRRITTSDGWAPALGESREAATERLWRDLSRQIIDAASDWAWDEE
jgi:Lipopolysaccharide-assembly